jgi:hypothetical protein
MMAGEVVVVSGTKKALVIADDDEEGVEEYKEQGKVNPNPIFNPHSNPNQSVVYIVI